MREAQPTLVSDTPADGVLSDLIAAAVLAPSSHNTQPWRFRVDGGGLELYADRTRALPVNDPEDRELTISCGAALFNARAAAAWHRLPMEVELLPDPADPDLLARLRGVDGEPALQEPERRLYEQVADRRTYRKAFADREVPAAVLVELTAAAWWEGAWLKVFETPESRLEVAALVAEGDRAQWADRRWRRELALWMHPRRQGDGLTVPDLAAPVAHAVVRTFDLGRGVAASDQALAEHSPVLAVLGTDGDQPRDWLTAGQALERVLLAARSAGLQASYLNQPIQQAELRPRLQDLLGRPGWPQILLRLGYPNENLPPAPRRPLAEVVESGAG